MAADASDGKLEGAPWVAVAETEEALAATAAAAAAAAAAVGIGGPGAEPVGPGTGGCAGA